MATIKNIDDLTKEEIQRELDHGARFVVFKYCFSYIIMTHHQSSDIYFVRSNESSLKHSIWFILLTLILGWWGFPWGPIYTIGALATNFTGGTDVTEDVLHSLNWE